MLQKNQNQLDAFSWVRQVPSPIALLDKDFNLVDTSEIWNQEFGFTVPSEEIVGRSIFDLFPKFADEWKTHLQYARDGLKNIQIFDRRASMGIGANDRVWILNPWKDGYGNTSGIILKIEESSQEKSLQMELAKTRNILHQKGAMARIASWEYDLDKQEVEWSPAFRKIYGLSALADYSLEQLKNSFKPGTSQKQFETALNEAIEKGKPWNLNLPVINHKAEELWVQTIGRPKFKDGKCSRIIGTLQDITDQILLQESAGKLEDIADDLGLIQKIPAAIALIDSQTGKLLFLNEQLKKLFCISEKHNMLGKSYRALVNIGRPVRSRIAKELQSGTSFGPFEISVKNQENRVIHLKLKGQQLVTRDGRPALLVMGDDIGKTKKLIRSLNLQIEDGNKEIEKLINFAHMSSHNLKAHATNFSILLNFLESEKDTDKRKEILDMMSQASTSLTSSIKGLREVVAIRHNLNIKKKWLVLNDYIYKTEQSLSGIVRKEGTKIINEVRDDLKVFAIPAYLESVLYHLLSNAIQFRKADRQAVVVLRSEENKDYTTVSIEDNGIGMDLAKFKDRLYGLYKSVGFNGESRGMGLYLTKYQMDLIKGRIECTSTPDEGTTFTLYFRRH